MLEAEVARRERMVRELVGAARGARAAPPPVRRRPRPGQTRPPAHGEADAAAVAALDRRQRRLREQLDALALELARREGEAQASAWTIAELERSCAAAGRCDRRRGRIRRRRPAGSAAEPLAAALDELDALRRALAQEHEARVRAESGEELVRARAEIQRQAALLAQLGGNAGRPPAEELR